MDYDLIVIGGGPTGYVAAERAGGAGLKTLLIEKAKLGGVCLNVGCIPSKAMLSSGKIYHHAVHGAKQGIVARDVSFDYGAMNAHKHNVMDTLRNGIAGLMKKYKVDVEFGNAVLGKGGKVDVNGKTFEAANILIATGSSPVRPPIPGMDKDGVVDSTGILALEKAPESLVVIGGGVIGCEFACFYGSIGVPVTVIEMLPEICPMIDPDIARSLRTELGSKGITFHTSAKVTEITDTEVVFEAEGKTRRVARDIVLVATGRRTNVDGLGLEDAGIDFDRRGIRIDDRCATNVPGIWAGGDVTGRTWLAHAGSRMGEVVVHNITGRPDRMRFDTIPSVIYTEPEVAVVGLTAAQAKDRGIPVKTGKFPLTANGRFLAEYPGAKGMVKVMTHAETNVLLGVQIIGAACSEMIFGAAAMLETELRVNEIEEIVFPHPTVSEAMRDALFTLK